MLELLRVVAVLSSGSVFLFATSSMLSAGVSFRARDLVAPLRTPDRVLRATAANFVLVPLLAVGIARALALEPAHEIALVLLGAAAGAPFLIKLTMIAAGDVALSTALLVLLVPMTVVVMPIVVPWLAPDAPVSAGSIAPPLVASLLVPLAIGLVISEWAPRWAARSRRFLNVISSIALIVLLVSTTIVNVPHLAGIVASRAMAAVLLLLAGAFAIGFVSASPRRERRVVLGLGTAQRNIAAATVVAVEDAGHPDTLVLIVIASVVGLAVLIPLARLLRYLGEWPATPLQPSPGGST